jgi:membrane-bound lytic murein transglycosylase D
MVRRSALTRVATGVLALVTLSCSASVKSAGYVSVPSPPAVVYQALPPSPPPAPPDPVIELLAVSDRHFRTGESELGLGHMESARQEFDLALEVLIESPYGGRAEPRIRDQFDRLVDRISAYEVRALAEGDGFTEKQYETASIDDLEEMLETLVPPEPAVATEERAASDPVEHDVPIPLNQRVLSFIELFQGRLHDFIEEGMKRGARYLPMIQSVFRAEGLPLDLAYVPLVESAFKPNALSRAKAKGVWQFVRGTATENGLRQDWYIDERSDPEKATVAAAKYLKTLSTMFDGDWHLALASYNSGPGRIQRAMKRGRIEDFWTLSAKPRLLPRETRNYVPMILAAIVIARNPAQYGFDFEADPPVTYDKVVLPRPVDLRRIAEWTETSIDSIQALNPELRRWTTPVRDDDYELKVPEGSGSLVQARLDEVGDVGLASLKWYTVRPNESLATIARKLGVSRSDLADANYLKTTSKVRAGQQLMVPHEATVLLAARTERPAPVADSRRLAADQVVTAPSGDQVKIVYRVKQGDTLTSIARVFKTSVSALQQWNELPSSRIAAGTRLTIYTSRAN